MKSILAAMPLGLAVLFAFSQGQPGVNLDLGVVMDALLPGDQVSVPIILVTRNEPQVAKVSLEVAYPFEVISWVEAVLGSAAESVGAELDTQLVDSEDLERKIVRMNISASDVIPEGSLLTLTFEVSGEMAINHEIPLENLKQTAHSLDGQEVRARGLDGSIASIEPIPACFFYMH